jgi:hypothetical protein
MRALLGTAFLLLLLVFTPGCERLKQWRFGESRALRRLSDCTLPPSAPTEVAPFDLDNCPLADGDDITSLMLDIRTKWPGGFYVRAPSKTLTLISNTIAWPTATKAYYFLEDQNAANKLTVQHVTSPTDYYRLWSFSNFHTVKLGGPNLSLTFKGNHPGLANCDQQYPTYTQSNICEVNLGLLDFRMSDGTTATLADVRANVRFAQAYGLYTMGGAQEGGSANKIRQLNVAGLYYATGGAFFHQGVMNAWADPERTKFSDPYMRVTGWDGTTPGTMQGGLPMGCRNTVKDQVRGTAAFHGYYTDSITGGVTIEYGGWHWSPRIARRIGNSAADPFVIRLKDWMVTGPGTGYPAGVRVKKSFEATFSKGDPHDQPDTGAPQRFVKIIKLPSTYGDGPGHNPLPGCAEPQNTFDAASMFMRLENSVVNRFNRDWHVELEGDFNTNFVRGELFRFSFDPERSYRHTLTIAGGTTITDAITLNDTDTVTGPGTFTNLATADPAGATVGQANTVMQTNVAGVLTVGANTATTTVSNVKFTGAARAVITIGSGSKVVASQLCVPSGSTITGSGTLTFNGTARSLPFTISPTTGCDSGPEPPPAAPEAPMLNSVQ